MFALFAKTGLFNPANNLNFHLADIKNESDFIFNVFSFPFNLPLNNIFPAIIKIFYNVCVYCSDFFILTLTADAK